MQVTTIGVDLAKNIFQVHGITESDEVAFNRPLRRAHRCCLSSRGSTLALSEWKLVPQAITGRVS